MDTKRNAERILRELDAAEAVRWDAEGYTHSRDVASLTERRDFFALDIGTSGAFMIRKADGAVFGIRSYGSPDYRKGIGFAHEMDGADLLTWRWKRGPFRTDMREPVAEQTDFSEPCRVCGMKDNPAGGDGWDGTCSTCADKADSEVSS